MDLFVVDRYMGDDNSQGKELEEERESKKLSIFKKHLEKRKRSLASLDVSDEKEPAKKLKEASKVRIKSKKKRAASPQPNDNQQDESGEDLIKEGDKDLETLEDHNIENSLHENDPETKPVESSFTVIGGKKKKETIKVGKSLPDWLSKPTVIETDLSINLLSVDKLSCLSPHIIKRLKNLNIKSLFPIQKAVIPAVLNVVHQESIFCIGGERPSDICVSAPTGSGKTLSYVIPLVQTLAKQPVCLLQALVLLPTKDLACQVKQVFDAFVEGTNIKVGLACGNKAFAKEQESLIGQG